MFCIFWVFVGYFFSTALMWSCVSDWGRCMEFFFYLYLWRTNDIRCVKCTGYGFDHHGELMCHGSCQASTGGAVDMLPTAAVLQLRSVKSKGITPTIVLPITANYWSVTQLGEWLMTFQRDVEGFNYKQHTETNCVHLGCVSSQGLKWSRL